MNSTRSSAFEEWCKLSGLDRHFVRQNYAAVRERFDADPLSPMPAPPPPDVKPRDRYDEI